MVNRSEEILNAFAENFFYKETVISNLKYAPVGEPERELADIVFLLGSYVLAIQLKERNSCDQTGDITEEEKWLAKKCKQAKSQAVKTVEAIKSGNLQTTAVKKLV